MSTYEELMASGKVRVVDGWHVHAFYMPYLELAKQGPPRAFGTIDQLVYELRRPSFPWVPWLLIAAGFAYGVTGSHSGSSVFALVFALLLAAHLLVMAYRMSHEWQSSPLVACPIERVNEVRKRGHGLPNGAVVITFSFHGRPMESEVAADSLEYLRGKGHVQFEGLLLVSERRGVGLCLGVRAADGPAPAAYQRL
jgi:hypothetical protein